MNAVRTTLACLALAAGGLAAVAGSAEPPLAADEIAAVDLAQRIVDRQAALVVVDVRDADTIAQDRIPGARPLDGIGALPADATVVVYGERGVDARVAESLRASTGATRVLRLHGGYDAWNGEVLFPTVRDDATAAQQRRFAERAALARYFGGTPRRIDAGAPLPTRSRRGC